MLVQVKKMNGKTPHCVVQDESTVGTLKDIIAEKEYILSIYHTKNVGLAVEHLMYGRKNDDTKECEILAHQML